MAEDTETEVDRGTRTRQFSIFMENKVGKLAELVRIINGAGITILGLSVIDTADCAIDRMIVDDPEATRLVLAENGISYAESSVVIAEMTGAGALRGILSALLEAECNIHFAYSLLTQPRGNPCLVINVDDGEFAAKVLNEGGITVLSQSDLTR